MTLCANPRGMTKREVLQCHVVRDHAVNLLICLRGPMVQNYQSRSGYAADGSATRGDRFLWLRLCANGGQASLSVNYIHITMHIGNL